MNVSIGVVVTCHNRRATTLSALRALEAQEHDDGVDLAVYLVDDGSSDGTGDDVRREFPHVSVLEGDGQLFWNGGMRRAFGAAMRDGHDHYLWLNDDTFLDTNAVSVLLRTFEDVAGRVNQPVIVAGSTRHPEDGRLTYGGVERLERTRPLRFDIVEPGREPKPVETMNGNCVLIPSAVVDRVGNLEPAYRHAMGDYDYGLRAQRAGFQVWITAGTIAACEDHPPATSRRALRAELQSLTSIKALPPGDWATFARRWAGPLWPLYWASPYVRRTASLIGARS